MLALALGSCGATVSNAQDSQAVQVASGATAEISATGETAPERSAELKKLFEGLLADHAAGKTDKVRAAINGLKLTGHEKWFAETFNEDKVRGLTAEYDEMLAAFDQEFGKLLEKVAKGGNREVLVYMITPDGAAKEATGLQKDALAAMKKKHPLFTVKLVKPGESIGISVWSIVLQDGSFRFIGKMRKIK